MRDVWQLTSEDIDRLEVAQTGLKPAIVVRPHKDNAGIDGMDDVLTSLPRADTESEGLLGRQTQNTSAPFAFEMRYAADTVSTDRVLTLQYVTRDDRLHALLGRKLTDFYPESLTETRPSEWLDPDPGQYMAAATLGLRRYCLYPLKNAKLESFRRDPTGSILTEMVGAADAIGVDADVAVQVLARPAPVDWQQGVPGGYGLADSHGNGLTATETKVTDPLSTRKLRYFLEQPTLEHRPLLPTPIGAFLGWAHPVFRDEFTHKPSEADKQAATMLSDLDGRGWEFQVAIVAVSDDADLARERVASTAEMFDNFYEYRGAQTFVPVAQTGPDIVETATEAAGRTWPTDPEQAIVKPQIEVAGLMNIPKAEDVATNKLRWSLAAPGDGIPPGTARFDADRETRFDRAALQRAMLDAAGPDEPLWYGTGSRNGTEAGVFQNSLYHQFVGGATRQGKTTLLTNFAAQCFRGDGGGLIIDPKGLDAEDFLAEWPRESAADLIVMDLSDRHDRVPRFNFLEIPSYLDPGTRAHTSYVESLAEDILAMVAEAGGSDKYMGALMKRVVKTIVRGLAKSGETATLLDVAAACSSDENIERFRDLMVDEKLTWLRDTAERIAEKESGDLEPLRGRMDEWVLNDNVRELICARESSFSINDVVEDGKWLVVRFDKASSKAEVKMVGTALIRRTYFAQRHLNPAYPFDLICDEFDNIASEESNIHKILSEAAAFQYRCTLACQAPTNQLPERVMHSIENQCGTFISFNPGGGKDAKWIAQQHTVEDEDLLNLDRYKFYMRATTRDDHLTHSYMVDGFPPARASLDDTRGDEAIRALIEQSLNRYGDAIETPEEQRAASPFFADGAQMTLNASPDDGRGRHEPEEREIIKAVYDTALRHGTDGWVSVETVVPLLEARFDFDGDANDAWRELLQDVDGLDARGSNPTELKAMNPRTTLATVGTDQSAGGSGHAMLLWDAYRPLTKAGLEFSIIEASGTDPDAVAWPAPERDQTAPQLVETLTDGTVARVEAEHSTGETKPGQTVRHVIQASDDGQRAIVLCRSDAESRVRETLFGDPTCARSRDGDEIRYYNSPRSLYINGEEMRRDGPAENVWVEDTTTGEIILRDADGTEHARFEDRAAVFSDADAYPSVSSGESVIKRPVLPPSDEPDVTIIVVPEGATKIADLRPDVSDRAEQLYTLLRDVNLNGGFTRQDALALAREHGIDVSQPTMYRWVDDLKQNGVIIPGEKTESGAQRFSLLYD